jgi:DNA-binding transcriptional MocR family regulator
MSPADLSTGTVAEQRQRAEQDYAELVASGLKLDLTRGKPSAEQLDLAAELLTLPGDVVKAADGSDTRNYGGLQGLRELREIFAPALQVPVDQLLALGNSSLEIMHDCLADAMLSPLPGAARRWAAEERIAFLCPVPGYDRHFSLAQSLGVELITVPMTAEGPDMDAVERLVAEDAAIKGIWCVPKYSNPDGVTYSDATVQRLATMATAAPDFRIFWDNAYAVHHLTDRPAEIADLLGAAAAAGNPDRVFVFGSTSKVTLAGAGVAFFGSSLANLAWFLANLAKRSIGPDKVNHLRHAMFLQDEAGLAAHMQRHRALIAPKFAAVEQILSNELGGPDLATWTRPTGGYFVTLDVLEGCAKDVVRAAGEAGIVLTPAGATHPYGDDPRDAVIRIAPTFPTLAELEKAMLGLTVCVRLVCYGKLLDRVS